MTDKLVNDIRGCFPLTQKDADGFARLKVRGMIFSVRCYRAEGLGHVSVMQASGFFGLMKMDTLMIVPTEKDMPLLSAKPVIYAANLCEDDLRNNIETSENYKTVCEIAKNEKAAVIPICAQIEAEISDMSDEDKQMFLSDLGLEV